MTLASLPPQLVVVLAVAVILAVAAAWAVMTAQRLHRLHIRTDAALARLEAALNRRAAVLATLYPQVMMAAAQLEAITITSTGQLGQRAAAERDFAAQVAPLLQDTQPPQLCDSTVRVELAQRFYNEAVADTRALRLRPVVKALRLGGQAALPEFWEGTSWPAAAR